MNSSLLVVGRFILCVCVCVCVCVGVLVGSYVCGSRWL